MDAQSHINKLAFVSIFSKGMASLNSIYVLEYDRMPFIKLFFCLILFYCVIYFMGKYANSYQRAALCPTRVSMNLTKVAWVQKCPEGCRRRVELKYIYALLLTPGKNCPVLNGS